MNDPESSSPLDLRFLPSWLKEETNPPSYAGYSGEEDRPARGRQDRPDQRSQRGAPPRRGNGPGEQRRGPQGPPRGSSAGSAQRQPGGKPGQGSARPNDFRQRERQPQEQRQERPVEMPPEVQIQFLPEEIALEKVTEQILASAAAYPLFAVARMFLQRPERHHIRFTPIEGRTLYRMAGTPILSTDPQRLEAIAFRETKNHWFRVEVAEGEEIKGNFTSVARSSLTGKVFGPTSHHTFQSAIHREYDERFSRRMSFAEYRSNIESTSDPEIVERWKQEVRRTEKVFTTQAAEEQSFASWSEAETYFKSTILPGLIVATPLEVLTGEESREQRDQRLQNAIRVAWDKESRFPFGMVNEIRNHLQKRNLHIFKYKKRILLISTIKPFFLDESANLSESIRSILAIIQEHPGLARKDLATHLAAANPDLSEEETQARKTAMIGDLYWLIRQGHVIEFADGTLDLPLAPRPLEPGRSSSATQDETPEEQQSVPTEESAPEDPAEEIVEADPPQIQQPHQ